MINIFKYFVIFNLLCFTFGCSTLNKVEKDSEEISETEIVSNNQELTLSRALDSNESNDDIITKDSLEFLTINEIDVRNDLVDDVNIHFNSNIDSLLHLWHVSKSMPHIHKNARPSDLKPLSDSLYIDRLSRIPAVFDLSYNKIVKNYIKLYTIKRRSQVEYMLGLSEYYFPMIEEILIKEGIPVELKYLPIIESALNPKALSRAGASGLWQFMHATGKMYGLRSNSYVDERRDPIKSTYAAAKFLKDLYKIYGDWQLVIAAYNCGPGNVNKAIRRSGGKRNYWDIYYRLPRETRGYVPAYIAALYAFEYHEEHNLFAKKSKLPIAADTIRINKNLHFDQIVNVLKMPKGQLRELNPQFKADIIPLSTREQSLVLPLEYIGPFIDMQDSIFAYKKEFYFNSRNKIINPGTKYKKYTPSTPKGKAKVYYTVKPGDATGLIASWFNVRTSDLRYWNNIRRNLIKVGQKLVLYVPKSKSNYFASFNKMTYSQKQSSAGVVPHTNKTSKILSETKIDSKYVYYTVRSGDNFWTIAKKFPGISNYDIMSMNNIQNSRSLKIGQKLKIMSKS